MTKFAQKNVKHIHFIAIGGSVMHQLAICLQQQGWIVTGSDDEIFEPARTNLQKNGLLPANEGWFPEKITSQLDAVIVGMHAKPNNPELLKAQALQIPIHSYPQYIYEHARNKTRIVIGGSHGKTTVTSMIMHVLRHCNFDFDYLVGAKLANFDSAVRLTTQAPYIIIEGDEYLASPLTPQPKFHFYQPNIALLTGIAWDHINVFPTFEYYLEQFRLFLQSMPANATLIYNTEDPNVTQLALEATYLHQIPYQTPPYKVTQNTTYLLTNQGNIKLQVFGKHNLQNLAGAMLVCQQLGISNQQFYNAIQTFKGAARRLELLAQNDTCSIYKDFAHAPSKVKATTNAVKEYHPTRRLIACFELHTYSSLNKDFLPQYQNTLQAADQAIVFFDEHTFAIKQLPILTPNEVQQGFDRPDLLVFTQPDALLNHLNNLNYQNTDLLLMSSGNFGGIDLNTLTNKLQ